MRVFCLASMITIIWLSGAEMANADFSSENLQQRVRDLIEDAGGAEAFILPKSNRFADIPQDRNKNRITAAKVKLGKLLFHDTSFALNGNSGDLMSGTWSCATCHHAAAGFKSGIRQGIGEGGVRFGANGSRRKLSRHFDAMAAADATSFPDLQPVASPTILNSAWQDVMLWNGQFGNSPGGVNAHVNPDFLLTEGTPKEANATGMSGVEVQALAGSGVHRLEFTEGSPLQSNARYKRLWNDAFPGKRVTTRRAAKAIAAFERTVIANKAPFQRWLRGNQNAMTRKQLRGAALFFDPEAGNCVACHRGPALSSEVGATADEMFFAIGFDDLDRAGLSGFHGEVDEATRKGRGGFTGVAADNYKFKIPQLYNLVDAKALGHGATFRTVREIIEYKNKAQAQVVHEGANLDSRFTPLNLNPTQVGQLTAFVKWALRDPSLHRYEPNNLPSDGCIVVDALTLHDDGRCPD